MTIIIKSELCEKPPVTIPDATAEDIMNIYLKSADYFETKGIVASIVREEPSIDLNVLEQKIKFAIVDGVKKGYFGLGLLEDNKPQCISFEENCFPKLIEKEIITDPELCKKDIITEIELEFEVSIEKVADIIKMIAYIKANFDNVESEAKFKVSAKKGEISISDYENKIRKTLDQLNITPILEFFR